jgi:two-component system phosphate regulon sensor histidine kinase PhoR
MQNSTRISLLLSISISIFSFLILFLIAEITIVNNFIYCAILFVFSFILLKLSIHNYIKNKIKPIFKTIYEGEQLKNQSEYSLDQIKNDAIEINTKKDLDISNLQKQINFRKEFLGNISHELKTPLFSIQGYVETLIDGGLKDENINMAYLKKAAKNIERLSQIVGDIDLISKIESSALKLNKTKFSIESLITESIEDLELMADKNDIKIKLEATIKHSNVAADKERIKEVLINLISNSLKYGIEKGETTISLFDLEDKILIRIADNGLGIKKEQLPRIFERFYRIDDNRSRAQGGSGLGLAIVKHLIEAHKQKITVKSEFGAGSIFEFTLKKV